MMRMVGAARRADTAAAPVLGDAWAPTGAANRQPGVKIPDRVWSRIERAKSE